MNMENTTNLDHEKTNDAQKKKIYESPKLVEYGNIVHLTQRMSEGKQADAMSEMRRGRR